MLIIQCTNYWHKEFILKDTLRYGLILGYEDVNDHDQLRYDSALAIALSKLNFIDANEAVLAGKSTLNRLEYCPETILDQANSRYHRIEHQPKELEQAFVDIFLDSYPKPPRQIILDMDVTDDQVHGNQEGAFYNKYYHSVCYAPLYIRPLAKINKKSKLIASAFCPLPPAST